MPSDPYSAPGGGQYGPPAGGDQYGLAAWQNAQQPQQGYPGQGQPQGEYQAQPYPPQQYQPQQYQPQQGAYPSQQAGFPSQGGGYPGADPASGYPGAAAASGYPGAAPVSGYPGGQPVSGYPGAAPVSGYPGAEPVSGYPGAAAASGYPGAAPVSGYPGGQPVSGYPGAAPVSGYPGGQFGPGFPGSESYLGAPIPPQRRKRKKTVITAVVAGAATLLLVGGVGAWAAAKQWYSSGEQPEKAMPASVSLYGRLDLDPSLDQATKMFNLARKFPKVDKNAGGSLGETEKKVFESLDIKNMTYDSDVKPWFGHKIGVGLWVDQQSKPFVLAALSSTSDGKAKAALKKARSQSDGDTVGYSVKDGYALLAMGEKGAQKAAEDAASDAKRNNLDDSSEFSKMLGKMPKGQVAIGWADLDTLRQHLKTASGATLFSNLNGTTIPDNMSGHIMAAAQAGSNGFEFRLRMSGMKNTPHSDQDALAALGKLPGNTALAVGYSGASDNKSLLDLGALDSLNSLGGFGESSKAKDLVGAFVEAKLVTVAFTGMKSGKPLLNAAIDARSSDDAATIAKALKEYASEINGKVKTDGTTVEMATTGYSASGPALGGQQLYRDTMNGMPGKCSVAAYADVKALLDAADADSDDRADLGPLKAVGAGFGVDDGDVSVLVRAVL